MPADFLDSNVLLYVSAPKEAKDARARSLIAAGGCISVQVLNEFANVARRKFGRSWSEIRSSLDVFRDLLTVTPVVVQDHELGLFVAERYGLSFYDAVVVASALNAGCDRLWTEDMHNGLLVESRLRIENPFVTT